MKSLIAALALSLSACATTPNSEEAPADICDAATLSGFMGQMRNDTIVAEVARVRGTRPVRWIRPGDVVTMDHSPERLNIHLDAEERIERLACG